jgi:endonuclease/exonuclease/phosphatase family metal-dependent hydrolase
VQIRVATINILNDLSLWQKRRELLRAGLAELQADFICIQEANLKKDTAGWLAQELGYQAFICPKPFAWGYDEGIAILSREPALSYHTFDLGSQGRVAQAAIFSRDELGFVLVNTHLYWHPGDALERLQQVVRLQDWLAKLAGRAPKVVCGDFNGVPGSTAVSFMRQTYKSAYAQANGQEPEYTCPTPLPRSWWTYLDLLVHLLFVLRPWHLNPGWRGTLDYIFVTPGWKVNESRVILNKPAADDPNLYPSDHFGLFAVLER